MTEMSSKSLRPGAQHVPPSEPQSPESGFAIVLSLIFTILLYILVADLSVSGEMVRMTGENDALLARMRNQMLYQLEEAEDQLLTDLQGAAAAGEGEGEGGMAGMMGGAMPGAGGEGGEGGEEPPPDPSTTCDCSRDAWYHPVGAADNDLTTYTWVEDENRKLNILGLWSPDEDFAKLTRERLVRVIDYLREDTEFDVASGDAETIVSELMDWARRPDMDAIPRPKLKSDPRDAVAEIAIPLHLDELLMLPSVDEDLFFDKVLDGRVYLGLESVLTIWTSLKLDPGIPEKLERQRVIAQANGEELPSSFPAAGAESGEEGGEGGAGAGMLGEGELEQPIGEGIRININTVPEPLLRALFSRDKVPERVIDAILRFRNEVDEEAMLAEADEVPVTDISQFGDMRLGNEQKFKVFESVGDLEQIEEFELLADPEVKAEFTMALTTTSDVFSIHLATLYKKSEETRVYLLRRGRSIVMRSDDGEAGTVVPLVSFEERNGLRLQPIDLQEERDLNLELVYDEMDQYAQEERRWNPFLVDFFLPTKELERFYQPGR